jgi:hypothetical protein
MVDESGTGMGEDTPQGGGSGEIGGQGGEGGAAESTPPIGEDQKKGQTAHPAPPDDVGEPSKEELAEEGAAEGEPGT